MDWLFDTTGKSIASNAKRIVSDMHQKLELQEKTIHDYELIIAELQHLCTDSLDHEIHRLETRKHELRLEMETIDLAITERKGRLKDAKSKVKLLLKNDNATKNAELKLNLSFDNNVTSTDTVEISSVVDGEYDTPRLIDEDPNFAQLEDDFHEEGEMLALTREIEPNLLFILHRNSTDDVIIYSPAPQNAEGMIVTCCKVTNPCDRSSVQSLSNYEMHTAYGAKIIPNHTRDDADIVELPNPITAEKSVACKGKLIGAFELPIAPNVVIDVWHSLDAEQHSKSHIWATSCVDAVKFATLERIYVISEQRWGLPVVVQVDLFARHPIGGRLLFESIVVHA